jgi:hypothetical protein
MYKCFMISDLDMKRNPQVHPGFIANCDDEGPQHGASKKHQ